MNEEVVEQKHSCTQDGSQTVSGVQLALPDPWCFGLAHPYIQRLIFLAGTLEQSATNLDQPDHPRGQLP